jgi:hypothetical protein
MRSAVWVGGLVGGCHSVLHHAHNPEVVVIIECYWLSLEAQERQVRMDSSGTGGTCVWELRKETERCFTVFANADASPIAVCPGFCLYSTAATDFAAPQAAYFSSIAGSKDTLNTF